MFSCCSYTPEVKLNTDWQMGILLKSVCVVDGIASIAALYSVNNFWPYEKHIRLLAKKVMLLIRNIFLGELEIRWAEIWRNQELSKLDILLEENIKRFVKTLQWTVTKKR